MIGKRVACVMIPDFAIEVGARDHPVFRSRPLAMADGDAESSLLLAINRHAADCGVGVGMTVAQGGTLCPGLQVLVRDSEREAAESNAVYKLLQRISPYVEEPVPGLYYLDISGFGLLYRSEVDLAQKILKAGERSSYPTQLGMAANWFVALTAARSADRNNYTIVPEGSEKEFLAPLPVDCLPLAEDRREILRDLGIRTVGQMAALSSNELIDRFGQAGVALARYIRGEDSSLFVSEHSDEEFSDAVTLTFPLWTIAPLAAHVDRLLSGLMARLSRFSLGCCCVNVTLQLENHATRQYRLAVDRPTLAGRKFVRQLALTLGKEKLASGVTGVVVTIPNIANLPAEQVSLPSSGGGPEGMPLAEFDPASLPPGSVVYLPRLASGILPEQRFVMAPFSLAAVREKPMVGRSEEMSPPYALRPITGLRLVQPPQVLQVAAEGYRPTALVLNNRSSSVAQCDGPWRLSGGWWGTEFHRHYYEIETIEHERYLLYYDRISSRWLLHGIFD